jgi:alcohol dehydrogenase
MKAAIYKQFKEPITIETVPDPTIPEHGVVIKVMASGLCLSDWHGWMGHDPGIVLPNVPGHELAGTIAEVGKGVRNWSAGQRVTVPFVCGCGSCVYCREGNQQVCDRQFQPGFTAWGSFAEYVAIDYADENLVALPDDLDFVSAASLGCRFVTAYRAVADQAQLQAGQWLAVYGCGGVGLSAIQIAKGLGARVIAIDVTDAKCALAKTLGADHVLNARRTDVVQAVRELSRGGVHVSMDALGHPETCLNSIKSLRKLGKHLQLGLLAEVDNPPLIPMPLVIANELRLIGSHGMQAHRYPQMFAFIESTRLNLKQLLGGTVTLEDVPKLLPLLNLSPVAGMRVVEM